MPGPFPGMDPYVDSFNSWRDFHGAMITYMRDALNALPPEDYYARTDENLYVQPKRELRPDIVLLLKPGGSKASNRMIGGATLVADPPNMEWEPLDSPPGEAYIEIYSTKDRSQIITMIELLSPTNKTRGDGREEYLRKRKAVLSSATHLIEIDLIRKGERIALPPEADTAWDYIIEISRANQDRLYQCLLSSVRERLPRIPVPLMEGDPDVVLDLQEAMNRAYEGGAYNRSIDYRQDPVPPLTGDDALWMDELLREKGLRP